MQDCSPKPEFLCYKYRGIMRIDEIATSAVQFAWKCRKYQNWKEVQNSPKDKQTLLEFANALLEGHELPMKDYGGLCAIFYNVQCWRKRRLGLDEEPDLNESWKNADLLTRVSIENPLLAVQKVRQEIGIAKEMPPDLIWDHFYAKTVLEMLRDEGVPDLPTCESSSAQTAEAIAGIVGSIADFLCRATGTKFTSVGGTQGLLGEIYQSLGLPFPSFAHKFSKTDFLLKEARPISLLQYVPMGPLHLLKFEYLEGNIKVSVNSTHPFVKESLKSEAKKSQLDALLMAFGAAVREMPRHKETVEALSAYIGMFLVRDKNGQSV